MSDKVGRVINPLVSDIINAKGGGEGYLVTSVQDEGVCGVSAKETGLTARQVYFFPNAVLNKSEYYVQKPLTKTEESCKKILESIGFTVTR